MKPLNPFRKITAALDSAELQKLKALLCNNRKSSKMQLAEAKTTPPPHSHTHTHPLM